MLEDGLLAFLISLAFITPFTAGGIILWYIMSGKPEEEKE
ncbi:hypothetical protein PEPS_04080 [Persicobacter psychrovividus]|uniref:Uncharacterized protein n=1 Tax=Persicobacter psychrovividus TaxID=387638 RepID=A0ABM7VBM5_9BACT|nr:hypothetical protein PEPS_04080 [Persicobacter psychrovividus]